MKKIGRHALEASDDDMKFNFFQKNVSSGFASPTTPVSLLLSLSFIPLISSNTSVITKMNDVDCSTLATNIIPENECIRGLVHKIDFHYKT